MEHPPGPGTDGAESAPVPEAAGAARGALDHHTNCPLAIYQNVELDVLPAVEHLTGQTTLWLIFKEPVGEGFTFHLHSRFAHISEVTVNGLVSNYRRRDGLRNLFGQKKAYSATDMDLQYRAALEIAREGELEIVVPNLDGQTFRPPVSVPKQSPSEVHARFSRLMDIYKDVKSASETGPASQYDVEDQSGAEKEKEKEQRVSMLQVRIKYKVNCNVSASSGQPTAISFRKQPSFVKYFDQQASAGKIHKGEKTVCVYTGAYTASSMRNVDGVRCWLPTLDSLDQRFVFDVTLSLPKNSNVLCAGRKLANTKAQRQQQHVQGKARRFFYRFFTPYRIPAAQLGFFIGKIEAYKMPMYKMRGKVWIATGLGDYLGQPSDESSAAATSADPLPSEHTSPAGHKRGRADTESGRDPSASKVTRTDRQADAAHHEAPSEKPMKVVKSRNLYEDLVYHTFLGLDLGIKVLQTFAGHKYDYEEYTYVFVYDLGRDFVPFDGFALVDMRFLHNSSRVYMETPAHLTLVQAFLHSWLRSAVPIASYDCEFVLHGTVGYLMHFYCEEVFGDDEGQYYMQKMLDTVLSLEKQGRALPLCAFYPERYETATLYFGEYLVSKSVVLFHIIEQAIGGKDPMRVALKHMIKSPLLFTQSTFRTFNSNSTAELAGSAGSSPALPMDSPAHLHSPPYSQGSESPMGSAHGSPLHPSSEMGSPLHGDASPSAGLGYQSPYPYFQSGNMSPQYIPYHGAGRYTGDPMATGQYYSQAGSSPLHRERSGSWGSMDDANPLAIPRLTRELSINGGLDLSKAAQAMTAEYLTAETFLVLLRHASEASTEVDESLLERFVYECGALFLRVNIDVSERVENKPRIITVTTEQVGHKAGGILGKQYAKRGDIQMLMVEDRDNNLTEPTLSYSDRTEKYAQTAYSRPGRKGGKRRKAVDTSNLSEEQQRERVRAERERELRKSALQLVKSMEFPVRYAILDPGFRHIAEVHNVSTDALSVEQLNVNYDTVGGNLEKRKVHFQIQALRCLARSHTKGISQAIPQVIRHEEEVAANANITMSSVPPRSARVQLKAFADCIMGVTGTGYDSAPSDSCTSVFVRAEAAFAMAQWQVENAPFSMTSDYDPITDWPGMEMMIDCILELFVDTQSHEPLLQDCRNEGFLYLRNCLLLALSTIKSQQGYSPREVIELLLMFAEHIDDPTELEGESADRRGAAPFRADETHSIAVLFQAMSRLRHAPIDVSQPGQPAFRIIGILTAFVHDAFTEARTLARINHVSGDANLLPRLPGEGLSVAAAITCLSELDIQAISDFCSARGSGGSKLKAFDSEVAPFSRGIITGVRYQDYFMRPGMDLKLILGQGSKRGLKEEFVYFLCTPVVRLAAFEAFVRLCFAQHHGKVERLELQARAGGRVDSVDDLFFIPAAVEALQYLLENDSSIYVKQHAAHIFFDAVLERPPRIVMEALSLGQPWGCMGWSDPMAFTAPHRLRVAVEEGLDAVKKFVPPSKTREALLRPQHSKWVRIAFDFVFKVINRTAAFNQVVRTTLLQMWIYTFKRSVPRVMYINGQPPAPPSCAVSEQELPVPLSRDRFFVLNPTEAHWDFEQSLKHGPFKLPPKVGVKPVTAATARHQPVPASFSVIGGPQMQPPKPAASGASLPALRLSLSAAASGTGQPSADKPAVPTEKKFKLVL